MNTAFLFSAGRGLRLRPLTDHTPKPLCTINNIALIDYHLEKLCAANIHHVFINHAYLGDQIKRHIKHSVFSKQLNITFIPEPPGGLQTGGTILNALPLLGEQPFLAINADIFTDYDFSNMQCPDNSLAHLVLIKQPSTHSVADFGLSQTQHLCNINKDYIFSGIAYYQPRLFQNKQQGRVSLIPWIQEAAEKQQATGELYKGLWFDTGNIERLTSARKAATYSG